MNGFAPYMYFFIVLCSIIWLSIPIIMYLFYREYKKRK